MVCFFFNGIVIDPRPVLCCKAAAKNWDIEVAGLLLNLQDAPSSKSFWAEIEALSHLEQDWVKARAAMELQRQHRRSTGRSGVLSTMAYLNMDVKNAVQQLQAAKPPPATEESPVHDRQGSAEDDPPVQVTLSKVAVRRSRRKVHPCAMLAEQSIAKTSTLCSTTGQAARIPRKTWPMMMPTPVLSTVLLTTARFESYRRNSDNALHQQLHPRRFSSETLPGLSKPASYAPRWGKPAACGR
jgi:hypothetical protein